MNDIINHLKEIYIKTEIERKEANYRFKRSRGPGHAGNFEHYSKLEKLSYLAEDLEAILKRLTSNDNIKGTNNVSKTIFEQDGTIFKPESDSIFHQQARAMGVL